MNRTKGKGRVELYNKLSEGYLNVSIEKSISYATLALKLSRKLNDYSGKGEAYNNFGNIFYKQRDLAKALENYNSSMMAFNIASDDKGMVKPLNNIGIIYFKQKNYEKSYEYYRRTLDIQRKLGNRKEIADLLYNIGLLFKASNNYNKAIEINKESLKLRLGLKDKSIEDLRDIATSYKELSLIYKILGDYDKVIRYSLDGLKVIEETADTDGIIASQTRIGNFYYSIRNYYKALEYHRKSYKLSEKMHDTLAIARALNNIGLVYYDIGKSDTALLHYELSLKLIEKTNDIRGKALLYNNIGLVYMDFGDYKKALYYCQKALNLKEKLKDLNQTFSTLTSIGLIFIKLNRLDSATIYGQKSLAAAKKLNDKEYLRDSYFLLNEIYSGIGNYKKALTYHKLYSAIKDSLLDEQSRNEITSMEVRYETEKKEKENELLRRQNEIQRLYFTIVIGLVFVIALVLYNRYRTKRKANLLLTEKNLQIERANVDLSVKNLQITAQKEELGQMYDELIKSENKLREAINTKDKFFQIIAHDLKNPLTGMILSSWSLVNNYEKMEREQLKKSLAKMHNSTNHIKGLMENLLQWAMSQSGQIPFNQEVADLKLIVENSVEFLRPQAVKKNITINKDVKKETYVYCDVNMISSTLRNLLSNSIKFTKTGGEINITAKENGKEIVTTVNDNGVGISQEDLSKLFRIDIHHTRIGTSNEEGTGLGLILCKEFVEKNGGTILAESESDVGSSFIFTLPKVDVKDLLKQKPKLEIKAG